MAQRTKVIFESAPSARDGLILLGRIVINPHRPLDAYAPIFDKNQDSFNQDKGSDIEDDKSKQDGGQDSHKESQVTSVTTESDTTNQKLDFLNKYQLDVVTDKGSLQASTKRSRTLKATLTNFVTMGLKTESEDTFWLESDKIKTYKLGNHHGVFRELDDLYDDEIKNLMTTHKTTKAYMMVTLRTALDPDVKIDRSSERSADISSTIPIDQLATNGALVTSNANLTLTGSEKISRTSALKGILNGERAFSAEYCQITLSGKTLRFRELYQPGPRAMAMRHTNDRM